MALPSCYQDKDAYNVNYLTLLLLSEELKLITLGH
jgi:hypothetical protein